MQMACGCCATHINAVTLKGIDKTDGTTVWEYGPGSFWRHHYGADAISGVVPNLSATLNKYAIAAKAYPTFAACGNRNTATLTANCAEALTVTKLNSLDGTVSESATLTGFFCDVIGTSFVGLMTGLSITNAAALSGGDYVIVGERLPFIEFVDYSSNTVNKEYILHAHGQQNGNVYLKTRTSNETITIPQDSTAAEVEALFEATSDCVAATATGGPWPLLPISIDVEWSVSGGDIASIAATDTYSAEGLGTDYDYGHTYNGGDNSYTSTLTVNTLTVGSEWSFQFDGTGGLGASGTFTYTSTTTDPAAFAAALETAFAAYQAAHSGEANWAVVVLIDSTGNSFSVEYDFSARFLTLTIDNAGGSTDSRRAGSCAASYDTGTGAMTSAVGYNFGYSSDRPTLKMFSETADLPSVTGLNVLGISAIGSGPSDAVVVTPALRGTGDGIKANVVEKWSIASGVWSFGWQTYCNAGMAMPQIIPCESGYVICPIDAKRFDGTRDRNAARIAVADTTTVELLTNFSSVNAPNNNSATVMYDSTPGSYLTWAYDGRYTDANRPNNLFRANADGSDTYVNGNLLRLGATAFGADGSSVFGIANGPVTRFAYVPGTVVDNEIPIRFWPEANTRSAEPQQFRFRFANGQATAWIDWFATWDDIHTALIDLLGENTNAAAGVPGYASNVEWALSELLFDNNPVSLIEVGLWLFFLTDFGYSPGSGFIPQAFFSTRPGDVSIEIQTSTPFATPGIAAYNIATADEIWSRAWGTKGAATISQPLYAWLEGDFVYAYGNVVDSEF